jgi:Holliday junction resolvase RusA-like endonuclease
MNWTLHSVIEVAGDPKGQPRPRAFSRGGKARIFDCGSAEGWTSLLALAARDHLPAAPLSGPVRVDVEFRFRRPQRLQKKSSPEGFIPHTARPDRDNLDKAILDCLTQIGFLQDDALVVEGTIKKHYTGINTGPGALIEIYTLTAPRAAE